MRNAMVLAVAVILTASNVVALDDNPENRRLQAARYLEVSPLEDMMYDVAVQGAKNLPPEQRELFIALLTKHLDIESLTEDVCEIMVKHFTAEELEALADFYGSEVGKSAMKKFGVYMADAMPIIQAEMLKAQAKANRELESPAQ